ncbi:DUF3558 family protein [Parasphingorhabdus pacifica]
MVTRAAAVVFGVSMLTLSACGGSTEDPPAQQDTAGPTSATEETQGGGQPSLVGTDPCALMTADEASGFGVQGAGESKSVAGAESCRWRLDSGRLNISLNTDRSLNELNFSDGEAKATTIEGRDAKLVTGNTGSVCTVALAVGASESVAIDASVRSGTETACQMVEQAAPLVAAKLPQE